MCIRDSDFTHGAYRAVWRCVVAAGGPAQAAEGWAGAMRGATTDERVQTLITALAVEPVLSMKTPTEHYVRQYVARLRELAVQRHIAEAKSRLQRTDPSDEGYQQLFADLITLEQQRRELHEQMLEGEQ